MLNTVATKRLESEKKKDGKWIVYGCDLHGILIGVPC